MFVDSRVYTFRRGARPASLSRKTNSEVSRDRLGAGAGLPIHKTPNSSAQIAFPRPKSGRWEPMVAGENDSNRLDICDVFRLAEWRARADQRQGMINQLPTNNISERLLDLKREMNELTDKTLHYRARGYHTEQEKAAHALRRQRLLAIKEELSNMIQTLGIA
jgi:hypothetical protein